MTAARAPVEEEPHRSRFLHIAVVLKLIHHASAEGSPVPILLAPGPTEVAPAVLKAASHPAESHFSQSFADVFGDTLSSLRPLFQCTDPQAQPFVLGGSGTLGWDFVATNFIAEGEAVLCLSTGFFANGFYNCLTAYGADTTKLTPTAMGRAVSLDAVAAELRSKQYKAVVATHVETSTAVLTQLKPLSDLIRSISPETLLVVDAVASLVSEELRFSEWDIDIVLTGSQKALSCPPGLSITMVSSRAIDIALQQYSSQQKQRGWYASLPRWLPIMRSYEAKKVGYFATPPTQLFEVWRRHKAKAASVREAISQELGLVLLSTVPEEQANGLTACWLPEELEAKDVLGSMLKKGFMLSGGMHAELGTKYVRFGHMGYSAFGEETHVQQGLEALKEVFAEFRKVDADEGDGDSGYASPGSV
ncbi:Alanine--glyoxylate aminotransferase 1 [Cyphellophora attinorum]|uniref:alanine--glyoxylate transaminase n=1 Tax=Cyphellophora attinorum TaxID=1664694 RepID=A0A0N1H781_9EURO|nr:Alanine--glyoxylate aminotransferase 1 [Phialophora attinorum]KPI38447.1 Alanine--glyoxylate aminotransferase 1 [Phialophora attinorum]